MRRRNENSFECRDVRFVLNNLRSGLAPVPVLHPDVIISSVATKITNHCIFQFLCHASHLPPLLIANITLKRTLCDSYMAYDHQVSLFPSIRLISSLHDIFLPSGDAKYAKRNEMKTLLIPSHHAHLYPHFTNFTHHPHPFVLPRPVCQSLPDLPCVTFLPTERLEH